METRSQIEQVLEQVGVSYRWHDTVKLGEIEIDPTTGNHGRIIQIDQEAVNSYAVCMKNGDIFPPIVIAMIGKKYVSISGNHRCSAARQIGKESWDSGVIEVINASQRQIENVAFILNKTHGKPLSPDDRVSAAIQFVKQTGSTQEEAGKIFGVTPNQVSRTLTYEKAIARIDKTDYTPGMKISVKSINKDALVKLNQLTDENVFINTAILVKKAKMLNTEVDSFVDELKKKNTTKQQLDLIESKLGEGERIKKSTAGADGKVKRMIRSIESAKVILGKIAEEQANVIPPEVRGEFKKKIIELEKIIKALIGIYQ